MRLKLAVGAIAETLMNLCASKPDPSALLRVAAVSFLFLLPLVSRGKCLGMRVHTCRAV
jgi:hypothetical protein